MKGNNMAIKAITKNCKKCADFKPGGSHGICTWGKSKKVKLLVPPLGKKRVCNLIEH